ncbi:hypothetical protein BJF93_03830 [Xaviernesmea oryzae]|uniref:DUF2244 domain-containing protein n=1 Tax=Xaviernesmea oryzae TaxID=464029 RepID=A0A1Q9AUF5_9HYPH|nr:DUF2244 domain-containing protein [Xaviernesmea oryzae]OLP59063.1 hypothetical protein BJF93_03830 [Xaviernesmea oryzae]SEK88372.1 Uncharacterized membrane protein [Xaviernesmea oryzae]
MHGEPPVINPNEQPVFEAELHAHRSLGAKGTRVLVTLAILLSLGHTTLFLAIGAWPVLPFFGLDILLLLGAVWMSHRAGRAREEVRISRIDISLRKFSPGGAMVEHRFNPFSTRLDVARDSEIGITAMHLAERGRMVPIGAFLNPEDRESFATAFSRALAEVRH